MVFLNINCLLVLLQVVQSFDKWPHPKQNHLALGDAVALLTRRYFSQATNTIVIVERSLDSNMYHLNKRVLEHILANLQDTVAVQLYNGQSDNQPWDYHIFVVDSLEAFDEIRWSFPQTYYERDFRFLIVLTKFHPEYFEILYNIFSSCRRFHVINANIIIEIPSLGVFMFKYNLFTSEKCHFVQPYLFFSFNDNINKLPMVFPQMLSNFHGCFLNVTARLNPPFLTFSGDTRHPVYEKDWKNLGGIDGDLLKLLARTLNFSINLQHFPEERSAIVNFTGIGCFGKLQEGLAEIAVGGFSASNPKRLVLTVSDVYQISPVVLIIRGGRQLDPLSRLASPFKRKVWLYLTLTLSCSVIGIAFLRYTRKSIQNFVFGEEVRSPMTNFLAMILGYPVIHLPLRNFARYLFVVWLLGSLVIRNAYQGSLFDSFRLDKFSRIPKGFNELMVWKYKILISKEIEESETFPSNVTINFGGGHGARLRFLEHARGRYATVAIRDSFMNYLQNNYRNGSKLIMVDETVYLHSGAMFFRKHSMYATVINKYLRLFNDVGISAYLGRNNAKDKGIFQRNKKGNEPLQAINYFRLSGIFEIHGVLLIVAVFVFILELLSKKWKKLEKFLEMIN